MPGTPEIVVIAILILLLFGGKKIPELMRGLGKGLREFRNARDEITTAIEKEADDIEAEKKVEKEEKPKSTSEYDKKTPSKK